MRWVTMTGLLVACSRGDVPPTPGPSCVAVDEVPYDGLDQDCDGVDLVDVDRDGHDAGADCDDEDPDLHPGAPEVPYDGVDQDCADGDLVDVDQDGHEGPADCDDADPASHPGADDPAGDGVDADCDGFDGTDADGDGFASRESEGPDCDDADPAVNPDAAEVWYDGLDQDCDRACDYDQDGDGHVREGAPVGNGSPCDQVPGGEVYAPEDCADLDPLVTDTEVSYGVPGEGEVEVAVDAEVTVYLDGPDPAPTVTVLDPGGTPVPGTLAVAGGALLTFVPDVPFAAGTVYTIEVTHGCGTEGWSFVTAYEAQPVDASALVGAAWSVDLAAGQCAEPVGICPFLGFFVSEPLAIEVLAADVDTLDLRLGDGDGDVQGLCAPTVETSADYAGNPDLGFGPVPSWAYGSDTSLDLLEAELSAGVRDGGALLADVALRFLLDTRPLVQPLLGFGQPEDAVCVWSAGFGDPCEACPDGSGDLCLRVRLEDGVATPLVGGVVPRTQAEIDADPACP